MNKKLTTVLSGLSLSLAIVATLAFAVIPGVAHAQQPDDTKESITLSPAVTKPVADAGTVLNGKLTVINDGKTDFKFLVYAGPFSVTSEDYDPSYTEVNDRTDAYQWIKFEKTNLNLKSGERVDVPYTMTIPTKASSGGHYAVLFAETQPPAAEGTQVIRKKRVGSLAYITVNGDLINSGSLASWDVDFWQKKSPPSSSIRIKNDGNVHFQVNSTVKYSNIFGKSLLTLNQEHIVLPGTTRRITANFEGSRPVGIYKVSGTATFLGKTEDLSSKWIVLLPMPAIYMTLGIVALIISILFAKSRISKRKKATASRRGKK